MCTTFLILCNGCTLSRILCSGFAYVPVSAGIPATRIKSILSTVERFNKSSTSGPAINIVVTQQSLLHSPSSSTKEISGLLQEFADILVVLDDHTSFVNQTIFQTTLTHSTTTTGTSYCKRVISQTNNSSKDIAYMMFTSGTYNSLTANNDSDCCCCCCVHLQGALANQKVCE
jgi:hypothetical protein